LDAIGIDFIKCTCIVLNTVSLYGINCSYLVSTKLTSNNAIESVMQTL